jgi:hypothetical protein
MKDLEAYSDSPGFSIGGAIVGGGGWGAKELGDLIKAHKDYRPPRLLDGSTLDLREKKPNLMKFIKQNPETVKAAARTGKAALAGGLAKGAVAGGLLGAIADYIVGHGEHK